MKKYQIVLVSISGLLILLWIVGRLTNAFQYYSAPTGSNEPAYKQGSHFFASNLITPKRFDFICYKVNDREFGIQTWFHRICGMPGDTVELRNGDLYVNGINHDTVFNLKKLYVMPIKLSTNLNLNDFEMLPSHSPDSVIVPLQTINQKDLIRQALKYEDYDKGQEIPEIKNIYGHLWTAHNFGPYVVPAGKYFVMGDNRYFSQDSRYMGPVSKNNIVATVIR